MKKRNKVQRSAERKNSQIQLARLMTMLILGVLFLSGMAVFAGKGGKQILSYLRPSVEVNLSGTVNRDNVDVKVDRAGTVKSGEVIAWKISSVNKGDGVAKNFKAVGQIPAGTEYLPGSIRAEGNPVSMFSIDNGRNFSERPMFAKTQPDGSKKLVPAPPSMFTQVQFVWEDALKSGMALDAFYSVRVK